MTDENRKKMVYVQGPKGITTIHTPRIPNGGIKVEYPKGDVALFLPGEDEEIEVRWAEGLVEIEITGDQPAPGWTPQLGELVGEEYTVAISVVRCRTYEIEDLRITGTVDDEETVAGPFPLVSFAGEYDALETAYKIADQFEDEHFSPITDELALIMQAVLEDLGRQAKERIETAADTDGAWLDEVIGEEEAAAQDDGEEVGDGQRWVNRVLADKSEGTTEEATA